MSRLAVSSFALAVLLAACGGEDENILPTVDGPAPGIDAPTTPIDAAGEPMPTAYFVNGDFNVTGIFTSIDVAARTVDTNAIAGVAGGDAAIRQFGNEVLIINRFGGDNITVLGGSPLALIDQFSTGANSNPHDVAAVGNKLYVTAYESAGIVVVDRTTREISTIALGAATAADDPDNQPECESLYLVGTKLFVACQRLDRQAGYVPRGPGRVVVIDTATDTVESGFSLGTAQDGLLNPVGHLQATASSSFFGGDLLVPVVPSFSDTSSGCVARIRTTGTPAFNGCAVTNAALTGYANRISTGSDGTVWISTFRYGAGNPPPMFGALRSLDAATGALSAPLTTETQLMVDVAACPGGYVVATDSAGAVKGARIYRSGAELTNAPLDLGRVPTGSNSLVCF